MNQTESHDVTLLIQKVQAGDSAAESALIGLVYPELRAIAGRLLSGERSGHSFQTTDLVHEAYLRLAGGPAEWNDRVHFFAVASRVMRHILVDYARNRLAQKRGAGGQRLELLPSIAISDDRLLDVLLLDELLTKLEAIHARSAKVASLRLYGGLSIEEVGIELGISPRTVKRDWNYARSWLQAEFNERSHHATCP